MRSDTGGDRLPALCLSPRESAVLRCFIVTSHLVAVVLLLSLPLAPWAQLAAISAVLASLVWAVRVHLLRAGGSAIASVEWDSEGNWRLFTADGGEWAAQLKASSYQQPWLVVLNFSTGRFGRRTLVVLPDAVDPGLLRRLRVRLRRSGAVDPA